MILSTLIPVIVILLVLLFLNVPIYLSLLACAVYMAAFINHMPMQNLITGMFEGVTKTSLLAIPFFLVAGSALAEGTLGSRLVGVFQAFFNSRKSGLAMACLGANAIFGAISGSPPAAVATFGKIMYKPLSEQYNTNLATGIIVCAASLSSIIPPSIPLIIYGIVAETSVAKLFISGIMPGILIVAFIAVFLMFLTKKFNPNIKKFSKAEKVQAIKAGIPVLILPVLVLGGIYGGLMTPVEAGAVAAVYAIIVGAFVIREMDFRRFLGVLKDGAKTSVQVLILVSCSSVFAQQLTITQMPAALTQTFSQMSPIAFLLTVNILFLIVGCFIDAISGILIFVPLLLPAAVSFGIDPVHFGIIVVINLSLGMFTPPFGLNLFVAQGIFKRTIWSISRSVIPYLFIYLAGLFLTTYIPAISLSLLRFM